VVGEVVSLHHAGRHVGQREVIRAPDQSGVVGASVVGIELPIQEPGALGGLDVDELRPVGDRASPPHDALVITDVHA